MNFKKVYFYSMMSSPKSTIAIGNKSKSFGENDVVNLDQVIEFVSSGSSADPSVVGAVFRAAVMLTHQELRYIFFFMFVFIFFLQFLKFFFSY